MGKYKIAILEGDGIGPEIVKETEKVLQTVQREIEGIDFEYPHLPVGLQTFETHGATLPKVTLDGLSQCDAALLGGVSHAANGTIGIALGGHPDDIGHVWAHVNFVDPSS